MPDTLNVTSARPRSISQLCIAKRVRRQAIQFATLLLVIGSLGAVASKATASQPASAPSSEAPRSATSAATAPEPVATPKPTSGLPAAKKHSAVAPPVRKPRYRRPGVGFAMLPGMTFSSDHGTGFGILAVLYGYDGVIAPYKWKLLTRVYATTGGLHNHIVSFEVLRVRGMPLRLTVWGALASFATLSYCGVGGHHTCDTAVAEDQADNAGLAGEDRARFLRRYYQYRVVDPRGGVNARWMLRDKPYRVELFASWRLRWTRPGTFSEDGPYAGSLYDDDFGESERGWHSTLNAGVMLDSRDDEIWTTRGVWTEASVRVGSPWLEAKSASWGANVRFAGYRPLLGKRLSVAARAIVDIGKGGRPLLERATFGGANAPLGFGGEMVGRGIRVGRVFGDVRATAQLELRSQFLSTTLFGGRFDWGLVAFTDAGLASNDLDFTSDEMHWGTGGGLRIAVNTSFLIRADYASSPLEHWKSRLYIGIGNVF